MHLPRLRNASIPDCVVWDIFPSMNEKVSISIRLDSALHQQLVQAAAKAKSPLNGEIQRRLALSFEEKHGSAVPDIAPQLTRIEHSVSAIAATLLKKGK